MRCERVQIEPIDLPLHERAQALIFELLSEEVASKAMLEGRGWSLDQAVSVARSAAASAQA
jgi:hypothetical protein